MKFSRNSPARRSRQGSDQMNNQRSPHRQYSNQNISPNSSQRGSFANNNNIYDPSKMVTSTPSNNFVRVNLDVSSDDEPLQQVSALKNQRKQSESLKRKLQLQNKNKWLPVKQINLAKTIDEQSESPYKSFNPDDTEDNRNSPKRQFKKSTFFPKRNTQGSSSRSKENRPASTSEKKRFSSPTKTKIWLENQKGYFEDSLKMKIDMNNFCVECHEIDPQWVSVNNGIFICINCAGHHRGFGVQVSFVRSLEMDKIDDLHLKMLKFGGNRKFLEFINLYEIQNSDNDRHQKYITKACEFYREELSHRAINDIEEFEISDEVFYKLPKSQGQKFIYEDSYVLTRRTSKHIRKQEKGITLYQEAVQFGQYLKEQIYLVPQSMSCVQCNRSCSSKQQMQTNKFEQQDNYEEQEFQTDLKFEKNSKTISKPKINYTSDATYIKLKSTTDPYRPNEQKDSRRPRILSFHDYHSPLKQSDNDFNYSVKSIRK